MRKELEEGYKLVFGETEYTISKTIGSGSNAIAYSAYYTDGLNRDKIHRVIIKELFPIDSLDRIYRKDGIITIGTGAEEIFDIHRKSYIRGNGAHLSLLSHNEAGHGSNINSFEKNGTLYSVLGYNSSLTLATYIGSIPSLSDKADIMISVLHSLESFHKSGLLHLDISSDNIMITAPENKGDRYSAILIDYNSAFSLEELSGHTGVYYSVKKSYTAPEVRLKQSEQICFATDTFSVVCVFYELLCGCCLDWKALTDKNKSTIMSPVVNALSGQSQTVSYLIRKIFRRGLMLSPNRRYATCEELEDEFHELNRRLLGAGVSTASLFEISQRMCTDFSKLPKDLMPCRISAADNGNTGIDKDEFYSILNSNGKKLYSLSGISGAGKTTLLKYIQRLACTEYSPTGAIMFYIYLGDYRAQSTLYITDSICMKIKPDIMNSTATSVYTSLEELFDGNTGTYVFLLDAFDEASGDIRPLIKEINKLAGLSRVSVVISKRTDSKNNTAFRNFSSLSMLPLGRNDINNYLNSKTILIPSDEGLLKLLSNPLMLTLYVKAADNGTEVPLRDNGAGREGIIDAYLKSVRSVIVGNFSDDAQEYERINYTFDIVLALIAGCMNSSGNFSLSQEKLREVLILSYNCLRDREFTRAYPYYTGKSRLILQGIENGDEWYDYAVNELLTSRLGLLQYHNGFYSFPHASFTEFLVLRNKEILQKIKKAKVKSKLPVILTITSLLSAFCIIVYFQLDRPFEPSDVPDTTVYVIESTITYEVTEPIYPADGQEKKELYNLLSAISAATGALSVNLDQQRVMLLRLLDEIEVVAPGKNLYYTIGEVTYEKYMKIVNSLLESCSNITFTSDSEDYLKYSGIRDFSRLPFSVSLFTEIIDLRVEEFPYQMQRLTKLTGILDKDSNYTLKEQKDAIRGYINYITACGMTLYYEINELIQDIPSGELTEFRTKTYISGSILGTALKGEIKLDETADLTPSELSQLSRDALKYAKSR